VVTSHAHERVYVNVDIDVAKPKAANLYVVFLTLELPVGKL